MYWVYRAFEVIGAIVVAVLSAALVCYGLIVYTEIRSLTVFSLIGLVMVTAVMMLYRRTIGKGSHRLQSPEK